MSVFVARPPWPVPNPALELFPDRLCFVPRDQGGIRASDLGPLRRDGTLSGTASYGQGGRLGGPAIGLLATSDTVSFGDNINFIPISTCTLLLGYRKRDATLRYSNAFGVAQNNTDTRCTAFLPDGDGVVKWDFGGFSEGSTRVSVSGLTFGDDIWAFTTGARGMEIWQNGFLCAANSATPTRPSFTSGNWGFGLENGVSSDLADYSFFYMYNRQLSLSDIVRLSADPWIPVRPRPPSTAILGISHQPSSSVTYGGSLLNFI